MKFGGKKMNEEKKKDENVNHENHEALVEEENQENNNEEAVEASIVEETKQSNNEEAEKWKDAYIRKVAEFENFRKRKEKEKEDYIKFAAEKVLVKTLEAVDNLERAVSASKNTNDFDSLLKGVEMTLSQLQKILLEEGVEAIEAEGQEFNPYEHQAMMTGESEEHGDNVVMQEFQKGYKLKGKVIRPSMVKVCKK